VLEQNVDVQVDVCKPRGRDLDAAHDVDVKREVSGLFVARDDEPLSGHPGRDEPALRRPLAVHVDARRARRCPQTDSTVGIVHAVRDPRRAGRSVGMELVDADALCPSRH